MWMYVTLIKALGLQAIVIVPLPAYEDLYSLCDSMPCV